MLKEYQIGTFFPHNVLFYESLDDGASEKLVSCDEKLPELCKMIFLKLRSVKSLRAHYESYSVPSMTEKYGSGIQGYLRRMLKAHLS